MWIRKRKRVETLMYLLQSDMRIDMRSHLQDNTNVVPAEEALLSHPYSSRSTDTFSPLLNETAFVYTCTGNFGEKRSGWARKGFQYS